jgi:murein DD-endopeptidase MepM/ murein hydrolase activator NlpD
MALNASDLSGLILQASARMAPLLPFSLDKRNTVPLDLSAGNLRLLQINFTHTETLNDFIFAEIRAAEARAAIGGYNEERILYSRSGHFGGTEPRTIHLGVDVWTEAGTPVFAPLAGKVHSFRDNAGFGDYGPTVILEHRLPGIVFFTLYGHLSRTSLSDLFEGKYLEAGQAVGAIGPYPENGDWPPHLHFQLITDMLGLKGDFPGVAALSQRSRYLSLCPDPTFLLSL